MVLITEVLDRVTEIVRYSARTHGVDELINKNDPLVDGGLSSVALVEIMLAVESEFQLAIPDQELSPINFASIDSIAMMLMRVLAGC